MGDLEEMNKERVRTMLASLDASLATGAYQATDEFYAAGCVTHSHPRSRYQGDMTQRDQGECLLAPAWFLHSQAAI